EHDVHGRAVRQEGHVLHREDLRDDALVAVAAGHLVADADLALLSDRDADHLVHARQELVVVLAAEDRDVDDLPVLARREPERGLAGLALVLLDVDGGELVVLDDAVAQDDGVLVVAALPGHERDEDVLAEGELALVGRVAVGEDLVRHDAVADAHDGALVEAGALVRADELLEAVAERVAGVLLDPDLGRGDAAHHAAGAGEDDLARVPRGAVLDPGADDRRLGAYDGHGLALHVGAHEGAVRVIVLEEWDERRRHRDDLLGRHVHEVRRGRRGLVVLVAAVDLHALVDEAAVGVEPRVRLHHGRELLLVGREVHDLVGHIGAALVVAPDPAVRRLDEPVRVPAAIGRQRPEETYVRTFRRLDRADAAVVTEVAVPDVEP